MEYSTEEEDLPPQIAELAQARAPTAMKGTRACKRCGIIKALDQFVDEGCENCPYLEMQDDPERANECTTAFFEGYVAVMDPRSSWTSKWLRVDNMVPGVYAITVTGQFDRNTLEDLESRGARIRCRPAGS